MGDLDLSWLSAMTGCVSAALWFYSASSVPREKELARRRKLAEAVGAPVSLAGVEFIDGENRYDLIATLRHQTRWSKWGAIFAAVTLLLQAADKYV